MKGPMVSIVVPAYNAEKTISRIMESVLGQPFENIELIVVNDGSKDGTAKAAGGYAKDKRVTVVTQANKGVSAARNTGIRLAKGKYLMFFDADDDIKTAMIEKMAKAAERREKCMVVCGKILSDGRVVLPDATGMAKGSMKRHVLGSVLRDGLLYSPCNKIYHADVVREHGILFDEKVGYGEDLIFNLSYLENMDSIYYLKEPLYIYEYSRAGSSAVTAGVWTYREAMYKALVGYLGENGSGAADGFLLMLVKLRWRLSVWKARARGARNG